MNNYWETPFMNKKYPSVFLFMESINIESKKLIAIVLPEGIDNYPKYKINFGSAFFYSCFKKHTLLSF